MAAGVFKGQCLKVLDRAAATRTPEVVSRRARHGTLAGSLLEEHGDPFGTVEVWDDDRACTEDGLGA